MFKTSLSEVKAAIWVSVDLYKFKSGSANWESTKLISVKSSFERNSWRYLKDLTIYTIL